jgi:hypothetical protein
MGRRRARNGRTCRVCGDVIPSILARGPVGHLPVIALAMEGGVSVLSRASVGGAAGARGVGLQDKVFAWAAVAMLVEQPLPRLPLPGTVTRVGAQTGFEVDDVAIQNGHGGLALCQVKGGLSLGTTEGSPMAEALDQVVAQYLAGMPEGSGRRRPQPGLDALVLVTDAAATRPVRQDLAAAISRAGSLPPGTPLASQLTRPEEEALGVVLGHLRRSWTARAGSPSEEDLRELLGVARVLVLETTDGGPDRAAAIAMLRGLVPAGREAEAWTGLVAVGHAVSEAREWRDRRRLVADLAHHGVAVGPGPTLARDIEALRAVSQSNLAALRPHMRIPVGGGIHLARAADAALSEANHADGGVLVVGDAGVGKTGLVVTLAADHAAAGQEVVLLRASDVAVGAVGGGVTLSRPLDQALLEWTGADLAMLVVDALDAARGGEGRMRLAALVTALAGSRWQVVATVRTYDVLYGPQLRAAFAGPELTSDPGRLDDRLRGVRHLRVDDLTDAELAPVASGDTALAAFISDATHAVLALLRNPFNLRLAAELLAQGGSLTPAARARLSAARTRLDLLGAYWEHRVDGAEDGFARTDVLTRIAEEMLARRRLRVLAAPPAVHGSDDAAVTGLLSDNLLALEQPGTGARRVVIFDHHILFDYALMRCVLRDPLDPLRLLQRLDADPALPLVARPSFDLLFDQIWEEGGDRAGFWQLALGLAGSSHLLASLAAAARLVAAGPDGAGLNLLAAACTSVGTSRRSAGYALLAQLVGVVGASLTPDAQVATAAPGLASLAVSLARDAHHTTAQLDCLAGTVNLLSTLNRRRPLTSGQPDAPARAEAIVDLLDACRSDPGSFEQVAVAAARQLGPAIRVEQRHVRVVARLLDDQAALSQWGGRVLTELGEAIPQVARADPALALRLARTAWAFDEPREETVALAASPLLSMTETRRDQADMARWMLGRAFPELCHTDLATAARFFAEIANADRFPARDAPQDREAWPLVAGEARGWLSHGHDLGFLGGHDAATAMAAAVRDALAKAGSDGLEPGPVVEVLVASLHSAPAWAAILADAGGTQVDGLAAAVLPALDTGSLLAYPDTHEPAGRLLGVLASHADVDQHARLEAAVLAAGGRADAAGMRGDRVTDTLLGCLDPARVTDEVLKARLAALAAEGGPPPLITTPPVEMLYDGRITITDRLDASDEPSAVLRSAAEALDEDLSKLADGPPDEQATARERLPERFLAADAAGAWSPWAPLAIRHDLVRAAALLAIDDRAGPGTALGVRVAAVLLDGATAADAGSAQPGDYAWSAGVRDDAASGIVGLLRRPPWRSSTAASQLRAILRALLVDANPVVRMQTAKGLPVLRGQPPDPPAVVSLVREYLLPERHPLVLFALLKILVHVTSRAPQAVDALLEEFSTRPQGAFLIHEPGGNDRSAQDDDSSSDAGWTGRDHTVELVAAMLVFLAVDAGTLFALRRLDAWFATPLASPDRTQALLHHLRPFLNPAGGRGQPTAFGLLARAADAAKAAWQAPTTNGLTAGGHEEDGQARARTAALLAHHLAQQLAFASGAMDQRSGTPGQQPQRGDLPTFATQALPLLRALGAIRHPQVTQPVAETLVHLSPVEPRTVLLALAEAVPERGSYTTDTIAAGLIMSYLTRLLAEHRDLVLGDDDGIAAFRHLLQAFAGAGHPEALAMAYTFSDVFR